MNIKITDLSKGFDNKNVLDSLTLNLENISSLAITGPSGGGKSTLLRILAGLITPDTGQVIINAKEIIFDSKQLHEYRKTLGVVFQSYNLFPHMSALKNITLPMIKVHHKTKLEAEQEAIHILEKFKLTEHMHKKPAQMSGGQQQRIAIARALAVSKDLLLLDEPTSALDPFMTGEVLDMLKQLEATEQRLMIIVTHELSFAREMCKHMIYLDEGKVVGAGETDDVLKDQWA